jgi:hypothetical protein
MARFTVGLAEARVSNLWKIATVLKAGHRRIRRFLPDHEIEFTALGHLSARLLPQNRSYKAVLDRTERHFGSTPVNIPMVGIAHRGIAFPVS